MYRYHCYTCAAKGRDSSYQIELTSGSKTWRVLCNAISNGHSLAETRKKRPQVWKLLFKDDPLLTYLADHSSYDYDGEHHLCVIDDKGVIRNAVGHEICPDCREGLDSLWYEPPFDPCRPKHLSHIEKRKD